MAAGDFRTRSDPFDASTEWRRSTQVQNSVAQHKFCQLMAEFQADDRVLDRLRP